MGEPEGTPVLELQPGVDPDPAMTSSGIARKLGVTDQTVRNWARRGLRSCGADQRGRPLYRLSAARLFVRREIGERKGGRRPRAGRPRGGRRNPLVTELPVVRAARAEQAERRERVARVNELKKKAEEGTASVDELMELAGITEEQGGLTKAQAERSETILRMAKLRQELDRAAGRLVDAAEVRSVWARALTRLRSQLLGLPPKAAAAVAAALGLDAGKAMVAQGAIQTAVDGLIRAVLEESVEQAA